MVIDLDAKIPKAREYMHDPIHFTNDGSILAAQAIAEKLKDVLTSWSPTEGRSY